MPSIELRLNGNYLECDWGVIEHGDPRPERDEVGHLMLITPDYLDKLLSTGPIRQGIGHDVGRTVWAHTEGGMTFAHLDYWGRRWTWKLFNAHFSDGLGPPIYLGCWPD